MNEIAPGANSTSLPKPACCQPEVNLDVLGPVPVDAGIDGIELVGPDAGIGQTAGEDLAADIEVVISTRPAR